MFKQSKRTLTLLVAAVAVALVWGALSLSAHPPGHGQGNKKDEDTTPPAAVTDLEVIAIETTSSSITLMWTATANNGNELDSGPAFLYDIRYSTSPITDADFDSAALVSCDPFPTADLGQPEMVTVGDLSELTGYYLALKVRDLAGNWSDLSNVVFDITDVTPPGGWAFEVFDPFARASNLALAYDAIGNPSIAYTGSSPLQLASWNDVTENWEIELIQDLITFGVDLAFDPASGEATVSYGFRSTTNGSATRSLNFARRDPESGWLIDIVDDTPHGHGRTSLAYNPSGNPSISYKHSGQKNKKPGLKFAFWDGSSWVLEMVDPDVDVPNSFDTSLAYDPATGEATIAYERDGTLKFCRRVGPEPGSWNIEVIPTVASLGHRTPISLAYVPDEIPSIPSISFQVISPDNPDDHILKFAYLVDGDPPSWVIETLETCNRCGARNSLAYAADGTAYISYTANYFSEVKLARRIGLNNWEIETVTSCVQATATSLKFDSLGNPSVAYSDNGNKKLKFARIVPFPVP